MYILFNKKNEYVQEVTKPDNTRGLNYKTTFKTNNLIN